MQNSNKLVSIIVRTFNEEKWINHLIKSIKNQTYTNFEIIVVDSGSVDQTINIIKKYKIKYIILNNFKPGFAINEGIRSSNGDYIVIVSAHCIPENEFWLENFVREIESNNDLAGVYGRQLPFNYSSSTDKRDLYNLFGNERILQTTNSFFHNANSIIRRKVWQKFSFDEKITNIEDRIWADNILKHGYKILYSPLPAVFHWHGIYHHGNIERANKIAQILDDINTNTNAKLSPEKNYNLCIIPIKTNINISDTTYINAIKKLIKLLNKVSHINEICLYCDRQTINSFFKNKFRINIINRKKSISKKSLLNEIEIALKNYEKTNKHIVDNVIITTLEYNNERTLIGISKILESHFNNGAEMSVSVNKEAKGIIAVNNNKLEIFEDSFNANNSRNTKILKTNLGFFTLINSFVVRNKKFFECEWQYLEI